MDTPGPGVTKISDEKFLSEWVAWGLAELVAYLAKYAKFADWLEAHERSLDG